MRAAAVVAAVATGACGAPLLLVDAFLVRLRRRFKYLAPRCRQIDACRRAITCATLRPITFLFFFFLLFSCPPLRRAKTVGDIAFRAKKKKNRE